MFRSIHTVLKSRARVPGCSLSPFTILLPCAHFKALPDETPGKFGSAVLSLYVRFTPQLEEAAGEIRIEVDLDEVEPDGTAGISGVSVSSALGLRIHLTSPVLVLNGPVWHPEHLNDLHLLGHCVEFLSFQLVVQARHSVPMRPFVDGQLFPLPLRGNPSFAVLLAQLDHDTHGQSYLLPQSCNDNPASVPCLEWEYSLRDSVLHFRTAWRVPDLPENVLRPDSTLDGEDQIGPRSFTDRYSSCGRAGRNTSFVVLL